MSGKILINFRSMKKHFGAERIILPFFAFEKHLDDTPD